MDGGPKWVALEVLDSVVSFIFLSMSTSFLMWKTRKYFQLTQTTRLRSVGKNTESGGAVNQYIDLTKNISNFSLGNSIHGFNKPNLRIHTHILKEARIY